MRPGKWGRENEAGKIKGRPKLGQLKFFAQIIGHVHCSIVCIQFQIIRYKIMFKNIIWKLVNMKCTEHWKVSTVILSWKKIRVLGQDIISIRFFVHLPWLQINILAEGARQNLSKIRQIWLKGRAKKGGATKGGANKGQWSTYFELHHASWIEVK